MESIIFVGIAAICTIFIIVSLISRRPDRVIDFALRACLGTAAVCLLDFVLTSRGYHINVGVNGITVLTNGLLGLPGFILLYGLAIYYSYV